MSSTLLGEPDWLLDVVAAELADVEDVPLFRMDADVSLGGVPFVDVPDFAVTDAEFDESNVATDSDETAMTL
ncbi:MAG TPA: hypothetical protein VM689_24295 [Aliidongia sp.]|nr:hypothetical protein [Aliidongia sp.]